MPTFYPRLGYILLLPDSDEDRTSSGIWFPAERRRKRTTGTVLIHTPSDYWLCSEDPLDGKQVIVEKWSWKLLDLGEHQLYLVPEMAVLGVLQTAEGEDSMKRDDVIVELQSAIKEKVNDVVDSNRDLTQEDIDEIQGDLADIVEDTITMMEEAEDTEEEESGEEEA